jgi:hypothetical protein
MEIHTEIASHHSSSETSRANDQHFIIPASSTTFTHSLSSSQTAAPQIATSQERT